MELVHRENCSDDTQGFQPCIDPQLEAKVILPKVIEKLKVGESPLDTESGSTISGIVLGESDSQGSGLAEAIITEDQVDLSENAVVRSKKYSRITDAQRRDFIDAVENNGEKIIHAAKRFNINYSSAKSILNVFKSEGRSLKKMTRNRNPNDDNEDENSPKPQEISGDLLVTNHVQKVTNEVSTQTCPEEEPQQENYLLVLRDRLLASKTEKRENPYSDLITHEATRYPENLKENPQHQMANSGLSSYISLQGTSGSQNSTGDNAKYFPTTSQPRQQYLSGIQAQYYQQHYQLGLSQKQEPINNLNLSYPQDWSRAQAQQQSGNNFSSMSYTGQYTTSQANENQKSQIQYTQPVMYVMPSSVNQLNFGSPIFQNTQNYAPHQNMYLYYGQNQNQEEGQNHNSKRG